MRKKVLNPKYKGTTWSNGQYGKPIVFDQLTDAHAQFLEKIGMNHLIIEVCAGCSKQKCKCKKLKPATDDHKSE